MLQVATKVIKAREVVVLPQIYELEMGRGEGVIMVVNARWL